MKHTLGWPPIHKQTFIEKLRIKIRNLFGLNKIVFPMVTNVSEKLISDNLVSVTPMAEPPTGTKTYIDKGGNTVHEYPTGWRMELGSNFPPEEPGSTGHSFAFGWYIVDENNKQVYFTNEKEYNRLCEKYKQK
jgi:hypothetical protein